MPVARCGIERQRICFLAFIQQPAPQEQHCSSSCEGCLVINPSAHLDHGKDAMTLTFVLLPRDAATMRRSGKRHNGDRSLRHAVPECMMQHLAATLLLHQAWPAGDGDRPSAAPHISSGIRRSSTIAEPPLGSQIIGSRSVLLTVRTILGPGLLVFPSYL